MPDMSTECVKRLAAEENRGVRPLIIDRLSPAARTFGKNFWAKTLFGEDTGKSKEPSAMLFQYPPTEETIGKLCFYYRYVFFISK